MSKFILSICLFAMFLLNIGCASVATGPSYSESKAKNYKPGLGILYIYRKYAEPTAWGASLEIDGKPITTLNQKGFSWVYVRPGVKSVKAVWAGMSGQKDAEIMIDIKTNETSYIELTGISEVTSVLPLMYFKMGSGLNMVKPKFAKKVLETCKFQKPISSIF